MGVKINKITLNLVLVWKCCLWRCYQLQKPICNRLICKMAENSQIAWVIDELGKMPWAVSSLSAFKASSPGAGQPPGLITPAVRPQTLQSVNKLNSSQNVIDNKSISVHSSRFVPIYSHFKHIHTHMTFHPALNIRKLNTLIIQTVCSRKSSTRQRLK